MLLYEEDYSTAIHHLELACKFDPGWPAPRQKLTVLKTFLQNFSRSVSSKGKLKPKRLSTIQECLDQKDKWVGKYKETFRELTIRTLREGSGRSDESVINDSAAVLIGGVVACVTNEDRIPL